VDFSAKAKAKAAAKIRFIETLLYMGWIRDINITEYGSSIEERPKNDQGMNATVAKLIPHRQAALNGQ
jgi:hypothetical protein